MHFVFSRVSSGGCCCYGGTASEVHLFHSAGEAKAALRASLDEYTWFPDDVDDVYSVSFKGDPSQEEKTIAALRRGENVDELFDFDAVSSTMQGPEGSKYLVMGPDLWEESWEGDEGTVAITVAASEERGDHGGHPRVDILSVTAVSCPSDLERGSTMMPVG